jgi:hypothetical protein
MTTRIPILGEGDLNVGDLLYVDSMPTYVWRIDHVQSDTRRISLSFRSHDYNGVWSTWHYIGYSRFDEFISMPNRENIWYKKHQMLQYDPAQQGDTDDDI